MQLESSRTKAGNKSNVRGICENTEKKWREKNTGEEEGERNKITIAWRTANNEMQSTLIYWHVYLLQLTRSLQNYKNNNNLHKYSWNMCKWVWGALCVSRIRGLCEFAISDWPRVTHFRNVDSAHPFTTHLPSPVTSAFIKSNGKYLFISAASVMSSAQGATRVDAL